MSGNSSATRWTWIWLSCQFGIEIQVFYDGAVIHSWLTYKPNNFCWTPFGVSSSCVSSDGSSNNTERINSLIKSPPAQHWFLIQYRYRAMPTSENSGQCLSMGHTITPSKEFDSSFPLWTLEACALGHPAATQKYPI